MPGLAPECPPGEAHQWLPNLQRPAQLWWQFCQALDRQKSSPHRAQKKMLQHMALMSKAKNSTSFSRTSFPIISSGVGGFFSCLFGPFGFLLPLPLPLPLPLLVSACASGAPNGPVPLTPPKEAMAASQLSAKACRQAPLSAADPCPDILLPTVLVLAPGKKQARAKSKTHLSTKSPWLSRHWFGRPSSSACKSSFLHSCQCCPAASSKSQSVNHT